MLALFHDKNYCNCIKLFPYILWDSTVLGLVLSWWRIEDEMKISVVLRLARKQFASKVFYKKATCDAHARNWKVKC